jgi:replicative DNA helicase Mcm
MVIAENNKEEQNSKNKGKSNVLSGEKRIELVARFKEFLKYKYRKKLEEAAIEEKALVVDFRDLDKFNRDLGDLLLNEPEVFFELYEEAVEEIEKLPTKVRLRVSNLPYSISIRDLRSKHIGRFISTEGIVRRASEIRPEIVSKTWECPACGETIVQTRIGTNIFRPIECVCGNRKGFKEVGKEMIDTRWIVIEEPFELTEGERPSQVTVFLKEDLVSPNERMTTEPGNRLKITGILREVPRGKSFSVKLDFFLDANHVQPMEIGWEKIKITEKDEKEIKKLAKNPKIYDMLIGSIAPSIYGLREIKESIVLQLFGGVPRKLKDKTKLRGDIHILLVGDPASGKSQLLKLVPQLVPRGKYVSGKGVTAAGLTASVSRDEQFMGGWVLEAGAMVLANKGLLAIDEFEKMSQEDQIAMHEALEQGCYDYNTEIIFEDGNITTIGDFVEKYLPKASNDDRIYNDISHKNIKIISTDFKDIKPSKIKAVGKHKENEMYYIKLFTGQELKITPKHPVFVIRKGKITFVEAKELKTNDWLPIPTHIPVEGKSYVFRFKPPKQTRRDKQIKIPLKTTPEFMEWLGYVVGEGNAEINRKRKAGICFTNSNPKIIKRYISLVDKLFGIEPYIQEKEKRKMIRYISKVLYDFIYTIGKNILDKPHEKSLPEWVYTLQEKEIASLLRGLFDSEGSVNYKYGTITFSTTSKKLATQVQKLCLRLGIFAGLYEDSSMKDNRKYPAYKIQISGKENVKKFYKLINFTGKNKEKLEKLLEKNTKSSKWNHVPNIMESVENVKKTLRLSDKECANYILTDVRRRNFLSKNLLAKILKKFNLRIKEIEKLRNRLSHVKKYEEFKEIREKLRISRSEIARRIGVSEQNLWYWKVVKRSKKLLGKSIKEAIKISDEMLSVKPILDNIKMVLNAPVEWVRIKSIKRIRGEFWVYDVTVNPTRTFIGNGIVCHNSVSIAKASIVATLPAQTSVLAGGNPKFSRFDPYVPIAKQITIPDTLLSRFDLKFVLRDIPNPKEDKQIVDHILLSREDQTTSIPTLDPEFVRKYIAYAKENCNPEIPKETGEILKKFYVETRRRAQKQGSAIPITLRQFEALLRLSEASARIQLSPIVRKQDAQRAIRLMMASLEQLGLVPETGEIDIDRTEGATTSKERSNIRIVLDIIEELSKKKKEILASEIEERAKKEGVESPEDIIERLKREGMLFEPSPGYVQKV